MKEPVWIVFALALGLIQGVEAREYHVASDGDDSNRGTRSAPLKTIQQAANRAEPGDLVTVHAGVYRERVNPPRGGTSDRQRITYQASKGERVEIKGSELIKTWVRVQENVWKAILPNSLFGNFNPYTNEIRGDWFNPRGRVHHTGAVYLNGEWLIEATKLDEVLAPNGAQPAWLSGAGSDYLLNVAWLKPGTGSLLTNRIGAADFSAQEGLQKAECSEGGQCIGFINHGEWARYDGVDMGKGAERLELRVASATRGGIIELRLNSPKGELLGTAAVNNTGGWQSWKTVNPRIRPTSGVKNLCLVFRNFDPVTAGAKAQLWFAQVDGATTTIWAQFKDVNPNEQNVEINARQTVFYPDQPGCNFITVRGFALRHAATPWAPPTSEQIGLIGTHWSKGWIIEENVVSHSICSGIALGKHGDQWDNTSANSAEGYVKTIERAHAFRIPWTKENIGHHVIRNNTISHCEQAGIVGSLGAAFSTVSGNTIHDIHVRRLFTGAEMAGIKFHAAIDSVIRDNHIYITCLGLWLDWMAQGTRVSGNLFHDNDRDLFVEVNHGPFMVDNNLFLSGANLLDMSQGGAYAHNLFIGSFANHPEPNRETPYHPPHSTVVAGLSRIKGGDSRFYNNIFVGRGNGEGCGLAVYNPREYPLLTGGNVYYNGAQPYRREEGQLSLPNDPQVKLVRENGRLALQFHWGKELSSARTRQVTSAMLGRAKIPGVGYENADGSELKIDRDYAGKKRHKVNPTVGPFEKAQSSGVLLVKKELPTGAAHHARAKH